MGNKGKSEIFKESEEQVCHPVARQTFFTIILLLDILIAFTEQMSLSLYFPHCNSKIRVLIKWFTFTCLFSFSMSFLASSMYTVPILFPGPRDPECNMNHTLSSSSRHILKTITQPLREMSKKKMSALNKFDNSLSREFFHFTVKLFYCSVGAIVNYCIPHNFKVSTYCKGTSPYD